MGREEILLTEYETCQSYVNSLGSQYWVSTSIFMSITTALLGWIFKNMIFSNVQIEDTRWLITIISTAVIILLILLILWLRRINFLINVNNFRMRIIETQLHMSRNRLVNILDRNWRNMSDEQQQRFREAELRPTRLRGHCIVYAIYSVIFLVWAFLIVLVWCPCVKSFIFVN